MKMNPIIDSNGDGHPFDERRLVDFEYFIQSAVHNKLPWNTLAYFLTDLAPTLDKSRQVIKILVQELEKWVTKVENKTENKTEKDGILSDYISETIDKELVEDIPDETE